LQGETQSKKTSIAAHQTQTQSNLMYRNLANLKQRVDDLIATYGEDAYVAAFVFSPADVFTMDEDFVEQYLPDEDACEVLYEVGNTDYIYQVIGECIDDEVVRLKLKQSIKK
jgi:hypothetical protein